MGLAVSVAAGMGVPIAIASQGVAPSAAAVASQQSTSVSSATGCTPDAIVTTTPMSGGGTDYEFNVGNGQDVWSPVPPNGFNPLTATESQLTEYGFPLKPTDPTALKQWESLMASYTGTPTPAMCNTGVIGAYRPTSPPTLLSDLFGGFMSSSTENWSGYQAQSGSDTQFRAVSGNYTQAALTQPSGTSCSNAQESSWVGIGGANFNEGLIQGGTAWSEGNYEAWYEWLAPNEAQPGTIFSTAFSNLPVAPGDPVHIYVSYEIDSQTADITVFVNGQHQSAIGTPGGKVNFVANDYNGSSVEWVDERPQNASGQLVPLAQWQNAITWSSGETMVASGATDTIQQAGGQSIKMEVGSTKLTSGGTLNSAGNGFSDTWKSCG